MKKTIWIILGVALIAVLGWFVFLRDSSSDQQNVSNPDAESAFAGEAIITYTDDGFGPVMLTVAVGATITIVNESSEQLDFSSDQHPIHNDNPELNRDVLSPGESDNFVVSEPGSWGYHNHLNPDKTGTIVVE